MDECVEKGSQIVIPNNASSTPFKRGERYNPSRERAKAVRA